MQPCKIVVVRNNQLMFEALKEYLSTRGFDLIDHTSQGWKGLEIVKETDPNIVIVGTLLDDISPIQFLEYLENIPYKGKKVLLAYEHELDSNLVREMMLYLDGAITTCAGLADIFFCLYEVLRQKKYVSNNIRHLLNTCCEPVKSQRSLDVSCLTQREQQIMLLISKGWTNKQIAEKLFLSEHTINNHRAKIARKLELKGSNQLIAYAISAKGILSKN